MEMKRKKSKPKGSIRSAKTPLRFQQLEMRDLLSCETSLCGDANLDGKVDFVDFLTLSANFGDQGEWSQGDFNSDGRVAFDDFLQLSSNYGQTEEGQPLISVDWEKTLDPFAPGAVWIGEGQSDLDGPVTVRAYDLIVNAEGVIDRLMFDVVHGDGDVTSLRLSGQFTPGEVAGKGSISIAGEQDATLESVTEDGLISTSGELSYTSEDGQSVKVTWAEKRLDPFNPLAVWAGPGLTSEGETVDVRLFDFVPGSDGTTVDRAIFEVTNGDGETTSMLMSGEFTPGETTGTGSILMTGEQGSTLHSLTKNGLVTTSGEITFLPEEQLGEQITVEWNKTLDPFAPGAVWVGDGITEDGTPVTVRAYDLVLADAGVIDQLRFDVTFPDGEVIALRLSGTFTPDATVPGKGEISITGELSSKLESTTDDGLLSTAGQLEYTSEAGELVKVTWNEKRIDPFSPLAVWAGSGKTAGGEAVDVRALDFVLGGEDGTTIERAIFEVTHGDGLTESMLMSGVFKPGEVDGSGSIEMTGEQGSTLNSATDNGLVTTTGQIRFFVS